MAALIFKGRVFGEKFQTKSCLYTWLGRKNMTKSELLYIILQRLDRAWYDMDSGYDETHNPFADVSDEYTKKKEEKMAKKAVKKMSAQQRQINKVKYGHV